MKNQTGDWIDKNSSNNIGKCNRYTNITDASNIHNAFNIKHKHKQNNCNRIQLYGNQIAIEIVAGNS